ncbi:YhbY family RNA-binding protein [Candidatus Woesearchaeota archaeon]|nr:YhbY family RNA-binding protein [Candidatus Woesearchaeota archaeon]
MDINILKKRAKTLLPSLRIGKFGLTENVHIEVAKLLKKRDLVKIKVLNNCPVEDIDEMIEKIVLKSKSILVSRVGNVFTIYKKTSFSKKETFK